MPPGGVGFYKAQPPANPATDRKKTHSVCFIFEHCLDALNLSMLSAKPEKATV
jgi:hypothetical protein